MIKICTVGKQLYFAKKICATIGICLTAKFLADESFCIVYNSVCGDDEHFTDTNCWGEHDGMHMFQDILFQRTMQWATKISPSMSRLVSWVYLKWGYDMHINSQLVFQHFSQLLDSSDCIVRLLCMTLTSTYHGVPSQVRLRYARTA